MCIIDVLFLIVFVSQFLIDCGEGILFHSNSMILAMFRSETCCKSLIKAGFSFISYYKFNQVLNLYLALFDKIRPNITFISL